MQHRRDRQLRTPRLLLRRWRDDDLAPFAAINADARVTATLSRALTRQESDALVARIEASFEHHGFGLWALDVPGVCPFAGFVGLAVPSFEASFTPCVEIGWRLDPEHWGQGYATEGASAVLAFAFEQIGLDEVVSFTSEQNQRSRAVMERLGMTHDPTEDFDHPNLSDGHPLRRHVLYRIGRNGDRGHRSRSGGLT